MDFANSYLRRLLFDLLFAFTIFFQMLEISKKPQLFSAKVTTATYEEKAPNADEIALFESAYKEPVPEVTIFLNSEDVGSQY